MNIHLDYMDYKINVVDNKHMITDIEVKDETKPHINHFVRLAKSNPEVEEMIRICSRIERLQPYVYGLKYGLMEITDPSNGYVEERQL